MYHNIVWDVDGTLFDTYPAFVQSFLGSLHDLGHDLEPAELYTLAKVSVDHCAQTLSRRFGVTIDEIGAGFQRHYALITPADQVLFPGVTDICRRIVDSGGKNVIVTHRGQAGTEELLAVHGLAQFFSGAVTADDGFPRKPDPAAFLAALERFSLASAETMTVGDREIDIQAGQAAGLFSCLFAAPDTTKTQADLVIADYSELVNYLEGEGVS